MSNGFVTSPESVMDMLRSADYAIITNEDINAQESRYTSLVKQFLASSFKMNKVNDGKDSYYVYIRK